MSELKEKTTLEFSKSSSITFLSGKAACMVYSGRCSSIDDNAVINPYSVFTINVHTSSWSHVLYFRFLYESLVYILSMPSCQGGYRQGEYKIQQVDTCSLCRKVLWGCIGKHSLNMNVGTGNCPYNAILAALLWEWNGCFPKLDQYNAAVELGRHCFSPQFSALYNICRI